MPDQSDRYHKRVLLTRCGHASGCDCNARALAELHARWCADTPDLAAQREQRDRVELADRVPALVQPPQTEGRDLLSALGAWVCLGLVVLLILALVVHHVWRVLTG